MDVFVSMESDLDETLKQNELLKDRLLEVTLAEDVKNLVINSCVEIRNKNLQDKIERFSKESKDVSNESKTADMFCNDAFDFTQELTKRIIYLEKDLSKLKAQSIAFEIALRHKLKVETNQCDEVKVKVNFDEIETKKIELEHRVASLLKENEHLKLVYNNLFDSIKKPRVQKENLRSTLSEFAITHILGKDDSSPNSITESNISELEKESGENIYENAKCELQTKIVELEKVLPQQIKFFDDVKLELSKRTAKFETYFEKLKKTKVVLERQLVHKTDDSKAEKDQFLKEINHLRVQLENLKGKSVETKFDKPSILRKPPIDKLLINSQISKSWFTPKVVVQKDLSKPVTAQSLPKNEKDQLLKQIASLESKLASQDLCSCQKEYHELRISYNTLKVKFDSLNRTKRKTNVSKSSKPKVNVSEKVHTGESSDPFSKIVSQFTTYFFQKYRRFSKKSQTFETSTSQKVFKKSALNGK
ncbi:hypothetical protein Tco_0877590 [Tanacetum coccineum]|uniref:Uncharacterized protein n=1 Tax=Tanacetum coccineum TaxID=301880 RepID=A0ABQ5C0R6_9ASTR